MKTLTLAAALLAAAAAHGATLDALVRTRDGRAVPQAVLRLEGPSRSLTLVSGPEGSLHQEGLEPGTYRIVSALPGFTVTGDGAVTVTPAGVSLDIALEPAPIREHVVVTATRGEVPLSTIGTSLTALDTKRIAEREAPALLTLLEEVPGVATARTGGLGSQASAFVRGGNSNGARLIVDGVPVNQPGGGFDLGPSQSFELERLEVVRGAASSLYGSDGLAGALQIVTRRGQGPADLRLEAEGGNNDTWRGLAGTSGQKGRYDWNLGATALTTDNEVPNNAFETRNLAFSGGADLGARGTLRLVVRGADATVGTPGQSAFGQRELDATTEHQSLATGLVWRLGGVRTTHEIRAGYGLLDQLSKNPQDSGFWTPTWNGLTSPYPMMDFPNAEGYRNETRRLSAGYQLQFRAGASHLLTAGAETEHETGDIGTPGTTDFLEADRTNLGLYLQDQWTLGGRAFLTFGGRLEHNGSFGTALVPRASLAVRLRSGSSPTTLKTSAGAGIKEPAFLESYGRSFFAQGNPGLEPERSRTFDLGLEQRLAKDRFRAELTFFHHQYRDLITYSMTDFTTYAGTFVNLGKTRARGLEAVVEAAPTPYLRLTGQYTRLDGEVLESGNASDPVYAEGAELLRRPANQASGTVTLSSKRLTGALSVVFVGERADSDFVGLGLTQNDAYTRFDARVRATVARGLDLVLVSENLFGAHYMEVLGYPALGRTVRLGLRYHTGAARP